MLSLAIYFYVKYGSVLWCLRPFPNKIKFWYFLPSRLIDAWFLNVHFRRSTFSTVLKHRMIRAIGCLFSKCYKFLLYSLPSHLRTLIFIQLTNLLPYHQQLHTPNNLGAPCQTSRLLQNSSTSHLAVEMWAHPNVRHAKNRMMASMVLEDFAVRVVPELLEVMSIEKIVECGFPHARNNKKNLDLPTRCLWSRYLTLPNNHYSNEFCICRRFVPRFHVKIPSCSFNLSANSLWAHSSFVLWQYAEKSYNAMNVPHNRKRVGVTWEESVCWVPPLFLREAALFHHRRSCIVSMYSSTLLGSVLFFESLSQSSLSIDVEDVSIIAHLWANMCVEVR